MRLLDNVARATRRGVVRAVLIEKPLNFRTFYHEDHVAFFPRIGICFNRIKKAGNTTVAAFLNDIENDFTSVSKSNFKSNLLNPTNVPVLKLREYTRLYSLAVVRNPFSRALSTYLHVGTGGRFASLFGTEPPSEEGFRRYLLSLLDGRLFINRHFWPQTNLLFQPVANYNYIAKLETLAADMAIVLEKNGISPHHAEILNKPHKVEAGTKKITSARERISEFYTPECIEIVRKLYREDFENFGYSSEIEDTRTG